MIQNVRKKVVSGLDSNSKKTVIIMKPPEIYNWVVFSKKKLVYISKLFLFWPGKETFLLRLF